MRALLFVVVAVAACLLPVAAGPQTHQDSRDSSSVSQAEAQLRRGDLEAAEKTLWTVLSTDPKDQRALTTLGMVRGRQGRYAEAAALFRRVLELNPQSTLAAKNLAGALVAGGKSAEAIEEFRRAVRSTPDDASLKVELARLYVARGSFAEALAILNSIPPAKLPSEAIAVKASSLLGLGRRSEALALATQAKRSPDVAMELAQVYLMADLPDKTLALLDVLPPAQSSRAQVQYLRGRALQKKGQLTSAMESFRRALAKDPNSADALVAMAEIAAVQKRNHEALSLLSRARSLNPDSLPVLRNIVVQAMAAGQNAAAAEAAHELQQKSSEAQDKYLVAAVMLETGEVDAATSLLEDYIRQRPQDSRAWLGLGIARRRSQQYGSAQAALQRALELNPRLNEAEYELGVVASRQGDTEEAIKRFDRASQQDPRHPRASLDLGTLYLQTGRLEKAQRALQQARVVNPSEPETEYQLSLLSNRMGKTEEARDHMQRFQRLKHERDLLRRARGAQTSKPR